MKKTILCGLILVSLLMTGCSGILKKKDVGDWKKIESECREKPNNEYISDEEDEIDLGAEKYKVVFGEKKTYDNTFLLKNIFSNPVRGDEILQDLCIDICENNLMEFETDGRKVTIHYDEKGRLKECLWYSYEEEETEDEANIIEKWECTYEDNGKYLHIKCGEGPDGTENMSKREYILEDNRPQSFKWYTSDGELTTEVAYEYDEQDRLVKEEYSDEADTVVEYHYSDDGKSKRIHITDLEGSQQEKVLEYDEEGRLLKKTLKDGDMEAREIKLQYNDDSTIRGIRYQEGKQTGWYKFQCS